MRTSFVLPLETERLVIRNWRDTDRDLFHEINSDEAVMEFFAVRRTRAESDALMDRLMASIDRTGFGFSAIERRSDGACLGFCGISELTMPSVFPAGTVEIGWRIAERHWGKGYVTEGAHALAGAAFNRLHLTELIAMAVPGNRRSTAVMDRLGMVRDTKADFDHPAVPDTYPHLQRHGVWRLSRQRWRLLNRQA
ncbi:MAG: GNAT family N-acetyltransferase [Rhizobiaceae bacterium]|nr:GNAT family N-acetyltransferase [Rhizobiaceae bacterium]